MLGSIGTIRAIIYDADKSPSQLPRYVMVQFDTIKTCPEFNDCFPVIPWESRWCEKGNTFSRRQLPILLAHASTIHEGLTLSYAVIDVGPKESFNGLSYVALSRTKSIKDIALLKTYDLQRYLSISNSNTFKKKLEFVHFIDIKYKAYKKE